MVTLICLIATLASKSHINLLVLNLFKSDNLLDKHRKEEDNLDTDD